MDFDPRDSDSRDEARWPERDRESPDRAFDSREPFMRDLNLPRGLDREIIRDRDREYTLRGSAFMTSSVCCRTARPSTASPRRAFQR